MKLIALRPGMLSGEIELSNLNEKERFLALANFLVAGAIGNNIKCRGIENINSAKLKRLADIIENTGAEVKKSKNEISAKQTAFMHGTKIDVGGLVDIIPALAVLCAFCRGESRICGVLKRSGVDGVIHGIAAEFNHLGIETQLSPDGLVIKGRQTLNGDGTYVWKSSPLAAALTIAASRAEGEVRIMGTDEIEDGTYERFLQIYEKFTEVKNENSSYKRTES